MFKFDMMLEYQRLIKCIILPLLTLGMSKSIEIVGNRFNLLIAPAVHENVDCNNMVDHVNCETFEPIVKISAIEGSTKRPSKQCDRGKTCSSVYFVIGKSLKEWDKMDEGCFGRLSYMTQHSAL